jgi:hypothetical protein
MNKKYSTQPLEILFATTCAFPDYESEKDDKKKPLTPLQIIESASKLPPVEQLSVVAKKSLDIIARKLTDDRKMVTYEESLYAVNKEGSILNSASVYRGIETIDKNSRHVTMQFHIDSALLCEMSEELNYLDDISDVEAEIITPLVTAMKLTQDVNRSDKKYYMDRHVSDMLLSVLHITARRGKRLSEATINNIGLLLFDKLDTQQPSHAAMRSIAVHLALIPYMDMDKADQVLSKIEKGYLLKLYTFREEVDEFAFEDILIPYSVTGGSATREFKYIMFMNMFVAMAYGLKEIRQSVNENLKLIRTQSSE